MEHKDFFKAKEIMLNILEPRSELPKNTPNEIVDGVIDILLLIMQKHHSPLAKKAFRLFQ